jgi:beta-lactamase class A
MVDRLRLIASPGALERIGARVEDLADSEVRAAAIPGDHPEVEQALRDGRDDVVFDGQPVSVRLHVMVHEIVANQLVDDDPAEVFQTARRLLVAGYDRHEVLHMLASVVADQILTVVAGGEGYDCELHLASLATLPGSWERRGEQRALRRADARGRHTGTRTPPLGRAPHLSNGQLLVRARPPLLRVVAEGTHTHAVRISGRRWSRAVAWVAAKGLALVRVRAVLAVATFLAGLCLLAGCGGTSKPAKATTQPAGAPVHASTLEPVTVTPASQQLKWVIAAINRGSAPSPAALARHFSKSFLHAAPPTKLVAAFAPLAADAPLGLAGVLASQGDFELQAEVTGHDGAAFRATIVVSAAAPHLIEGLLFELLASPISSWSGVDAALERLASPSSLYAGYASGGELHALNGSAAGAIGSAFKLYVLGALANAIEQGSVHWDTPLAIHNSWKSLPSGNMRLQPAGRTFTLLHYAQQMISVSDNTAADHLIHRLGRAAVEAQLTALGNHSAARDTPFLTTRELFALKLAAPPSLVDVFASADTSQRTRLLARIDRLTPTLAEAAGWTTPRFVNTIEWFASPSDLAHAISLLEAESHHQGLSPLRQILAINPGVSLNRTTWPYVAFKGGSEPGVISLTWYLQRHDGRTFVLSIILNDPEHEISAFAVTSVAEAAIDLLAHA